MSDPGFHGWTDEALEFYVGLSAENSKAYWTTHRPVFDQQVNAPMLALVAELEPRLGPGKVMRPYRDIRFSKDKSPYRTALGARVGDGYIQISARGLGAGCGYYHLASDQLTRYRAAVDSDQSGHRLVDVIAAIEDAGIDVSGTDPLKTAPRGYSPEHPRIELLRSRGLVAWKQWPPAAWLATPAAKDRILELFEETAALMDWLKTEVGPSTEPARGRYR